MGDKMIKKMINLLDNIVNVSMIRNGTIESLVLSTENITKNIERLTSVIANLQVCKPVGYGAKPPSKYNDETVVDNRPHGGGNKVRIGRTSATCEKLSEGNKEGSKREYLMGGHQWNLVFPKNK